MTSGQHQLTAEVAREDFRIGVHNGGVCRILVQTLTGTATKGRSERLSSRMPRQNLPQSRRDQPIFVNDTVNSHPAINLGLRRGDNGGTTTSGLQRVCQRSIGGGQKKAMAAARVKWLDTSR